MELLLVFTIFVFAGNHAPACPPPQPAITAEVILGEVAEVITAPVDVVQKTVGKAPIPANLADVFEVASQVKPGCLSLIISYIKNPKNTVDDIVWAVENWQTTTIRKRMPRGIYKELTVFVEALQELPRERLVKGIDFIKTSQRSSRRLAKILVKS